MGCRCHRSKRWHVARVARGRGFRVCSPSSRCERGIWVCIEVRSGLVCGQLEFNIAVIQLIQLREEMAVSIKRASASTAANTEYVGGGQLTLLYKAFPFIKSL